MLFLELLLDLLLLSLSLKTFFLKGLLEPLLLGQSLPLSVQASKLLLLQLLLEGSDLRDLLFHLCLQLLPLLVVFEGTPCFLLGFGFQESLLLSDTLILFFQSLKLQLSLCFLDRQLGLHFLCKLGLVFSLPLLCRLSIKSKFCFSFGNLFLCCTLSSNPGSFLTLCFVACRLLTESLGL